MLLAGKPCEHHVLSRRKMLISAKTLFSISLVLCVVAPAGNAQRRVPSPNQDEVDGVSAGGRWTEFSAEDKMTGEQKVRFELLANNYLSQDQDYKPRIELMCVGGKYKYGDFNPGIRLGPPNRPGFWGQPQMEVMVRIDEAHDYHGWNWVRDRFLSMDKGSVRGLMGAQIFNVQIRGRRGQEIAEFSPGGLDLSRVKQACDLTPKKPGKD
jgi:hypothetical protein